MSMAKSKVPFDQFLFGYEIDVVDAAKDIVDVIVGNGMDLEEALRVLYGHSDAHHREVAKQKRELLAEGRRRTRDGEVPDHVRREFERREKTQKKTDMGLTKTELGCTANGCPGYYYKQLICPGCDEGKRGFRVRLICDEDTDHEVTL